MSILVGTDFSDYAASALATAAHLAARIQQPLHLLHSVELSEEEVGDPTRGAYVEALRLRLEHRATHLRAMGASVTVHVEQGSPDDALLAAATKLDAKLIVVAAIGKRRAGKWQLGGHADRLAQRSHVPVLVVRNAAAFEAWAAGARALRIALGADLSLTSRAAMQWIEGLRAFGPCEVIGIHLYWPPAQFQRLGFSGLRSYSEPDPEVNAALEHELFHHLAQAGASALKLRLEPHLGRIGDRLAALAAEEQTDLLVVGSRAHSTLARILEGSVSQAALQNAQTSIACIPVPAASLMHELPKLRSVVVATDFSMAGNRAIPLAYGAAARGATVHLVHVIKGSSHDPMQPHDVFAPPARSSSDPAQREHDAARSQLVELIPAAAKDTEITSRIYVLESHRTAEAIAQAAERLDADVLCLGTHGRSGLSKTVLGSVADAVLRITARPVLLAQRSRE